MSSGFHFLRPEWLLVMIPAVILGWMLVRRRDPRRQFRGVIAPHLLDHLLIRPRGRWHPGPVHLLPVVGVLASLALAGPAWKREPPPFVEDTAPLVMAIDLSSSMLVEDVQPSRLERAKQKARDLLAQRSGARTGLLVYSGTAHTVLPLTDDPRALESFISSLEPSIMPVEGKDAAAALGLAAELLEPELVGGSVVFFTDGIPTDAIDDFAAHDATSSDQVLVLAISTERGGAVPSGGGPSKLDRTALDELSSRAGAWYTIVTVDDTDVRRLGRQVESHLEMAQKEDATGRWRDGGYPLVFPIAFFVLLWFRKGWVVQWND